MAEKLPTSMEAEQSVIGGLLISPVAFQEVADRVSATDFHDDRNRAIFQTIAALHAKSFAIDFLTVADAMETAGTLSPIDFAYLGSIVRDVLSAANVLAYADIVRSKAISRRMVGLGITLQQKSLREPPEAVLAWLSKAIQDIDTEKLRDAQKIGTFVGKVIDRIDADFQGIPTANPAIPTGLCDLDSLVAIRAGHLVVIAGRPSMGKTALAMQIASHISRSGGWNTLVFEIEMEGEDLAERELSARSRVSLNTLKTGQLNDDEWVRLTSAVVDISDMPEWIDDTPRISLSAILSRARQMHRKKKLGAIIVDHIGLIRVEGRNGTREQEVAEISSSLKALAKELKCPVIALSQLNRALESRQDKRPIMSDLRESGAIEQDADTICFIYRDEVYYPDSPDKGCAELIIRKQRGGKIGMVPVKWEGEYSSFHDLAGPLPSSLMPSTNSRADRGLYL